MEIWKDIEGLEGKYQVSNIGRVKSLERKVKNKHGFRTVKEMILTQCISSNKYLTVNLGRPNDLVHRLVAFHFVPNPNNFKVVNHINFDKKDNRSENLEWCTAAENIMHSVKSGRYSNKLTKRDVLDIRLLEGFVTQKEISKRFGVNQSVISAIHRGASWSYV